MYLLADLEASLSKLDVEKLRRYRRITDTPCAPKVTADDQAMTAFCSNDYLGLASHPRLVAALHEGVDRYGVGSGASHLISGHSRSHALLEDRFSDLLSPYLEKPRALYFSTGYMANIAVLSVLADHDADLFSESLNHASLIDGARLSRARRQIYAHGNVDDLERLLKSSTAKTKVVVTDSVFSMDGNLSPLPALLVLCERYGAWLVVDDAHGFGVLGEHGRGVLEHFQLRSSHLIYVGTLGKAAGVSGAFVAAHATVIEWLVQRARSYIYTTAAPPALAHVLLTSVDLITGHEGTVRRADLKERIIQFRSSLDLQRWRLLPSQTAIQPVVIGANDEALRVAGRLYQQGYWVPAIRPPTVPRDTARLRVTLSATHSNQDVGRLVHALCLAEEECNVG